MLLLKNNFPSMTHYTASTRYILASEQLSSPSTLFKNFTDDAYVLALCDEIFDYFPPFD